jgi:hypothetical protein
MREHAVDRLERALSTDPPTIVAAGHLNWDVTIHVDELPTGDGETQIERLEQSAPWGSSASAEMRSSSAASAATSPARSRSVSSQARV